MMQRESTPAPRATFSLAGRSRRKGQPPPQVTATSKPADPRAAPRTLAQHYDIALDNISVGISFFDAEYRLLLHNRRYAQIYGLTPGQVRTGMTLARIMALRARVGAVPNMAPDDYVAWTQAEGRRNSGAGSVIELKNGRVLLVRFRSLPDGGVVSTHEDITERRMAEMRIAYMAHHDAMTGLPNRVLLRERLEQALADAAAGQPCALLSLDLDGFKGINDALGAKLGDAVLRATATRLGQALPSGDLLARLGADEFAIVQRAAEQPADAAALGERLLREIARPLQIEGHSVVLSASIGIALAPRDGHEADEVLRHADLALSTAKAVGRCRVAIFAPTMDSALQRRRALEADLRLAVATGALALVYQPIANLQTGRVTGFEALVRWDRPGFGRVSPAEFIPLAEENGLIAPLGEWVLHRACAEAARWPRWVKVAVNVSAAQFRAPGLYDTVADALRGTGLAPARLELEITESAMMENWVDTAALLQRLKQLGVRIAMDDFGTGYSSLSYLRKFPFDKIKIDQAFIRELTGNSQCVAIVRAILALCAALGMTTTAEGVETQEQLDILIAEGCSEVQGYLLSTPRPPNEVPALLERLDSAGPAARPVRRPAFAPEPREAG